MTGAAMAQTVDVAAPPAPTKESDPKVSRKSPDRKVCKEYATTGSRLPGTKVCLTQERWDARSRDDREMTEGWISGSMKNNCIADGRGGCISG